MKKERLWTKEFVLTSSVNFVLILSMFAMLVTLAPYTIAVYNASMSVAGLVSSIFIVGVLIGRIIAGWQANNFGSKKLLIFGITGFIFFTIFYFLQLNIYLLILLRLLQGVVFGFGTNATGTIVSQIIPSTRRGEGIGFFSLGVVLSSALGPLIGTALIDYFNYNAIFIFSLIVGIIALILSFFIISPQVEIEEHSASRPLKLSNFVEFRVIPISIIIFVAAIGYSSILSFITTYADEINLSEIGGYFFLAYSLIIIATRPISGRLMDLKGENVIVYPSLVFFALGMLVLSQTTNNFTFILAALFIGLGYGNLQSIAQAIAINLTPIERMGLANSTYYIFLDVALGLGPFLLGFIIPIIGFRYLYLSFVGLILFNAVLYYLLYARRRKYVGQSQSKAQ